MKSPRRLRWTMGVGAAIILPALFEERQMHWFKPFGLVFYPVSAIGWLLSLAAAAFCAHIFLFFDARVHSVTDLLYALYPFWVPTLVALGWIADRTGGRPQA